MSEFTTNPQSTDEIRTHYIDFTGDLPSGVTVSSGTATHTPPRGAASTPTVGAVMTGDILPVTIGPLTTTGVHILTVVATLSDGQKSVARLNIPVVWPSARSTMVDLIDTLRGMTDANTDDYTIAGIPYWMDKQLQDVLDKHRTEVVRERLISQSEYSGAGTVVYKQFQSRYGNFEATSGGSAIFVVEDSIGTQSGTANWSADYVAGKVTFTSDQAGTAYYLTGRSYNLNAAAAEVWRMKAGQVAKAFNFSTDNHKIDRGQLIQHYLTMANTYAGMAGATVTTLWRSDVNY